MTCDEFQALSKRNPIYCTRAERAAHYCHMEACPSCRATIQNIEVPPYMQPLVDAITDVEQTLRAFLERKE